MICSGVQAADGRTIEIEFSQTIDLAARLDAAHVPHEVLVLVDETHSLLRNANREKVDAAVAAFLERHLLN